MAAGETLPDLVDRRVDLRDGPKRLWRVLFEEHTGSQVDRTVTVRWTALAMRLGKSTDQCRRDLRKLETVGGGDRPGVAIVSPNGDGTFSVTLIDPRKVPHYRMGRVVQRDPQKTLPLPEEPDDEATPVLRIGDYRCIHASMDASTYASTDATTRIPEPGGETPRARFSSSSFKKGEEEKEAERSAPADDPNLFDRARWRAVVIRATSYVAKLWPRGRTTTLDQAGWILLARLAAMVESGVAEEWLLPALDVTAEDHRRDWRKYLGGVLANRAVVCFGVAEADKRRWLDVHVERIEIPDWLVDENRSRKATATPAAPKAETRDPDVYKGIMRDARVFGAK